MACGATLSASGFPNKQPSLPANAVSAARRGSERVGHPHRSADRAIELAFLAKSLGCRRRPLVTALESAGIDRRTAIALHRSGARLHIQFQIPVFDGARSRSAAR